jgi:hypothetical protein
MILPGLTRGPVQPPDRSEITSAIPVITMPIQVITMPIRGITMR